MIPPMNAMAVAQKARFFITDLHPRRFTCARSQ
jgi:hypothetical protein